MIRVNIYFIDNEKSKLSYGEDTVNILIGTKISNYDININIKKIKNYVSDDDKNNEKIKVFFDDKLNNTIIYKLLSKIHDIFFDYKLKKKYSLYLINYDNLKVSKINDNFRKYIDELNKYKIILIDANKTPETYLDYVKSRIPNNYDYNIFNLKETDDFPLTKAVGQGSIYNSYFVHIKPKKENPELKTIYLIGKAITYDSGGLNLKSHGMYCMKVDMCGSAIILSVLNLLEMENIDSKYNIHLLIPIAENMISNTAIRPGQVVTALGGKTVEILNTDAEGRLCIADALNYINYKLLNNKDLSKCIILDIATLTGNASIITAEMSSIISGNNNGDKYMKQIIDIGENINEYVDTLKLRKEFVDLLKSNNADISNVCMKSRSDCVIGSTFLNYFVNEKVPYMHLDVAATTYIDDIPLSYGINLLVEFIKNIN